MKIDAGNFEDIKQVVRSSGSVGANYIEANENVGKGDLKYRIKVCRKEAKESIHFLGLVETFGVVDLDAERMILIDEANQLKRIFSTMLTNIIENEKNLKT